MATPKEIPSKINEVGTVTAAAGNSLYIVALLKATGLDVDSLGNVTACGPVSLPSPIVCQTFTATAKTVAYYEQ